MYFRFGLSQMLKVGWMIRGLRSGLRVFLRADAIVLPAIPCTAAPIATLLACVNGKTVPFPYIHRPFLTPHNLTGFPALVTPMGFSREGLPLSLQIVGRPWDEASVLRVAHAYEEATPALRALRPAGC